MDGANTGSGADKVTAIGRSMVPFSCNSRSGGWFGSAHIVSGVGLMTNEGLEALDRLSFIVLILNGNAELGRDAVLILVEVSR